MAHVVEELFHAGEDFHTNFYSIILPTSVSQLAGIADQLTLRIHKVSIPDRKINTYDITKRGRTFDRPTSKNDNERQVTFSFRPDKKLMTYKALWNWMNYVQNNETMAMASDSGIDGTGGMSTYRANLEVWAIDSLDNNNYAGTPHSIWTLEGAYPTSISGIEFDDEGGDDALDIDVTLNCFNIIYPTPII